MTVTLATQHRSPVQVFLGAFLGLTSVSLISIAVGAAISSVIPVEIVGRIAGGAFIILGLIGVLRRGSEEVEEGGSKGSIGILMVFSMIAAAEMGDKTQLAIIALAVEYSPFSVGLGVASAFAVLSLVAVALGRGFSRILPMVLIRKLAAITFLTVGVALILGLV